MRSAPQRQSTALKMICRRLCRALLQPIVDKFATKLPKWKGILLSSGGRLTVVKHVLSALPLYQLMAMDLPKWLIKAIEKREKRSFL